MILSDLPLKFRMRVLISRFVGWRHAWSHGTHVRFPTPFGPFGQLHRLVNPDHPYTDCSSFATYVIMCAYPEVAWTEEDYGDMVVYADRLPERPHSSQEALERRGVGSRLHDPEAVPVGTWFAFQGWRQLPTVRRPDIKPSGHMALAEKINEGFIRVWEVTIRTPDGLQQRVTTVSDLRQEFSASLRFTALGPG